MKPKTDLIVNSVCFLLVSPFLGIMVAGFVITGIVIGILMIAFVCGFMASLFFNVDFTSFAPRMETIKTISTWAIAICGAIGGVIWGCIEIKEHWDKFKVHGRGW